MDEQVSQGAQRVDIPAGFSGWWCPRCSQACPAIPEDLDARETKCTHCRKWTAVWIPPSSPTANVQRSPGTARERAGEERCLKAGAPWERKRPTSEAAVRLFEHMKDVIEHPELEPDLRKLDHERAIE